MFGTCVTLHRVGSLPGVISWRRLKIFRWASGLWGMFGDCLDYSLIIIYIWCPGYSWITILTAVFASSQPSHGAASIFRGGWTNKLGQFGGYQITFYAALILWWWWTFSLTSHLLHVRQGWKWMNYWLSFYQDITRFRSRYHQLSAVTHSLKPGPKTQN